MVYENLNTDFTTFSAGVSDATYDLNLGWVDFNSVTPEFVRAEFLSRFPATDEYLSGYLSVLFPE